MDKTIIFIHGFGGFAGIWHWQREYFLSRARVIAIDLPGHGARLWNKENLDVMARQVFEECQAQGVDVADVVASSFGGLVAIKLGELYPDFVRRMVLAGALPRFTWTDDFPAGLNTERIRKLAVQFEGNVASVLDMFFRSVFSMKEREQAQYGRIKELRRQAPLPVREALLGWLDMLEREDMRSQLSRRDKPSLFLFGDSDPVCPVAVVDPLLKLCPLARAEVFKGIGHLPFLTIPEVFNRRVERFLQ